LAASTSTDSPRQFTARHGLCVAWTVVENHYPEPPRLAPITALVGQDGEVAQSEVAVDTLVDAAELVGTLQGQDPPPACFGLRRLAGLAVEDGLAEMQLSVVWVHPQTLGTGVQSRRKVAEHLVAAGDQGKELAHDGIGGADPDEGKGVITE
jgi:hypothetical protein